MRSSKARLPRPSTSCRPTCETERGDESPPTSRRARHGFHLHYAPPRYHAPLSRQTQGTSGTRVVRPSYQGDQYGVFRSLLEERPYPGSRCPDARTRPDAGRGGRAVTGRTSGHSKGQSTYPTCQNLELRPLGAVALFLRFAPPGLQHTIDLGDGAKCHDALCPISCRPLPPFTFVPPVSKQKRPPSPHTSKRLVEPTRLTHSSRTPSIMVDTRRCLD